MTFSGRLPWLGSSPILAPTSLSCPFLYPMLTVRSVLLGRAAVWLSLQRVGRRGWEMQMWPYLHVCSCSFLESLVVNEGKLWAPQAAQVLLSQMIL